MSKTSGATDRNHKQPITTNGKAKDAGTDK
jgi:hypothetical protein